MPVLCFVIDTSASMNQKTANGQKLIDFAKFAVENFITKVRAKDPAARTQDKYLLVTTDEDGVKVGWKDTNNVSTFWSELRNLDANGLSNIGSALQTAFDLLNLNRFDNELDSIGRGRLPWMIHPACLFVITDGGRLTSSRLLKSEIELPGSSQPGSLFINEPFRWDQRVFSLTLKLPAHSDESDLNLKDPLTAICDVTGGRNYTVTSQKQLMECLFGMGTKVQHSSGVLVNFEKINEKNGARPELGFDKEPKSWYISRTMLYVRHNYKTGNWQGFWPFPEPYWPDSNRTDLPKRSAQPILKFSTKDSKPLCLHNFAFDKLELEPSPLTQAMLERKRTDVAWQVFVDGSSKFGGLGCPIGYLKPNTANNTVHLYIHPYNYPTILPLMEELFRSQSKPTPTLQKEFEDYMANVPLYYLPYLKKAFAAIRAPLDLLPTEDMKLHPNILQQFKDVKKQLRLEQDKFCRSDPANGKTIKVRESGNNPMLDTEFKSEFENFELFNKRRNVRRQPLTEPFDITRKSLLETLGRMRMAFRCAVLGGTPLHKEHILHEQGISQMGLYQEYTKNNVPPLRDPDPEAIVRKHTFGNPWKKGGSKETDFNVDPEFSPNELAEAKTTGRNRNNRESAPIRKRKRRLSELSFRGKNFESSDNESLFSEPASPRLTNGIHDEDESGFIENVNGFMNDNINGNIKSIETLKKRLKRSSIANLGNHQILESCKRIIRTPGKNELSFVKYLNDLDVNGQEPDVLTGCLLIEAIKFKRYSLLAILDGFCSEKVREKESLKNGNGVMMEL